MRGGGVWKDDSLDFVHSPVPNGWGDVALNHSLLRFSCVGFPLVLFPTPFLSETESTWHVFWK